jgi:hypothetical protein
VQNVHGYHPIFKRNMNDNKGQMGKKICSNTFALMAFTILTGFNIFLHQMMMLSFMAGSNFKIELLI